MTYCRKHTTTKTDSHCRLCHEPYCHECRSARFSLCEGCAVKALILIFIVMVIVSYTAWFGIF